MTARIGSILFPLVLLFSAACGRTDLSDLDTGDTIPPPPVSADGTHKIRIVGSSTVAPFATTVAERFGATTRYPTPHSGNHRDGRGVQDILPENRTGSSVDLGRLTHDH